MLTIALAGNPNSGKTSLFNALTGAKQHVGNWPGVTVEQKTGQLKRHNDVEIVDLPGIYSLSPYSPEEVVSRNYIINEHPDVLVNIIDATNLERNLYLTTQLLETGAPCVLALNMMDLVRKRGINIDPKKLSQAFGGVPVVEISALENTGIDQLVETVLATAKKEEYKDRSFKYSPAIEEVLNKIEDLAGLTGPSARYYAIKFFENDEKIDQDYPLAPAIRQEIRGLVDRLEEAEDNDAETLISNGRYDYISHFIHGVMERPHQKDKLSTSDKIDAIVTNRILALPIFALVIYAVYFVSIQTIGGWSQDWVGDGFGALAEWVNGQLSGLGVNDQLIALICDGIIGGVGAVLTFVPQLMILYFFLSFLEGCGYMSRIAFIMDRIFRRFGLSGKSFIPFLMATGCGVPAIMSTRTIENERDRRMTIMVTTFMPCGAKLPVIALFAGAFFPDNSFIAPACYFLGIAAIIISCMILKATSLFKGDPAPFIIELPEYRMPKFINLIFMMWEKAKVFIYKAGTIIFICVVVIWFLSSYNFHLQAVDTDQSILATLGGFVAPIFAPLGWGTWQATAGAVSGLVAKENLVSTLGVLFSHIEEADETSAPLLQQVAQHFTPAAGLSYLVFNLLCAPCFAAIGAIKREMMSSKWTLIAIAYQTIFAYVIALLVYQIGRFFL
ncbi:ferrous iron transport protein B [Peptococcus simiae]|uniref:Ferrous iron transport protein B n=1 Tax=Peptococcus simiae TaxID=1643805 RepID=A0ABW9GWA5_9FIRM